MVDISEKAITKRNALARCRVVLPSEITSLFKNGDIVSPKGPVFSTAIVAGTLAAKKTADLIPFCHPIGLDDCKIRIELTQQPMEVLVECEVSVTHKTGVEMEALTGASIAALTIYDMCKALSHNIVIQEIRLIRKSGGKSDVFSSPLSSFIKEIKE